MYDYVVIGSGPAGLTCANAINKTGHTCLVIDRENSHGGCHRVTRVNGLFTEHGPRIYSSAYLNFHALLKENNIYGGFAPYKFAITGGGLKDQESTMGQAMHIFTLSELVKIFIHYLRCTVNPGYYRSRSVDQIFCSFSDKSLRYLDKICRLTDGAGINRYTAYEFLQLINQNIFYQILEPTTPNDYGWVAKLVKSLEIKGVTFRTSTALLGIRKQLNQYILHTNSGIIRCKNVVFTTPTNVLEHFFIKFNGIVLKNYNRSSLYETYIPFTLHWDKKIILKDIWGQGIGPWNIAWVVMSDYMNLDGSLISCCISRLDIAGYNGKTANQCSLAELKKEALVQLGPLLEKHKPDHFVMSPQVEYRQGVWTNRDTAYMLTPDSNIKFPFKMDGENIYSVGTHNGCSTYDFTTAESAVQNALMWANLYLPNHFQSILVAWTLNQIILCCIIVSIIITSLNGTIGQLLSTVSNKIVNRIS